ncbi:hypothetical protein [Halegenticoccus soli]|uniref:hypothetical protein n=1 Tax=Halegenticoccus soli TaxID=1985678 RepID=UPI000C6EF82D|nr:hypothetical protein [Halegenticoccus soli]
MTSDAQLVAVRSNWWWSHVAVVLWTIVLDLFLLIGGSLNLTQTASLLALQAWLFVFLTFTIAALFGFYYDAREIQDAGQEWKPTWWMYIVGSFIVTPLLTSALYLFQRYRHVGIRYRRWQVGPSERVTDG